MICGKKFFLKEGSKERKGVFFGGEYFKFRVL